MLDLRSPFRLLVTLLLAVVVLPLCCCNFHSWLTFCVPCEAASHHYEIKVAVHSHADGAGYDRNADHHAKSTKTPDGDFPKSPCEKGHDEGDCTCCKQSMLLTIAKPIVEVPMPILVAILSFPVVAEIGVKPLSTAIERSLWASARPPTSLLLLHCALIV